MSWTQEEAEQAFVEVRKRAMTDEDFRELVLSNPKEAIEQVTGKTVPEYLKIQVIESDPNYDLTCVLPEMIDGDLELSEDELENIAGGACAADVSGACAAKACGAQASISLR